MLTALVPCLPLHWCCGALEKACDLPDFSRCGLKFVLNTGAMYTNFVGTNYDMSVCGEEMRYSAPADKMITSIAYDSSGSTPVLSVNEVRSRLFTSRLHTVRFFLDSRFDWRVTSLKTGASCPDLRGLSFGDVQGYRRNGNLHELRDK
jgi:hypothetical protein